MKWKLILIASVLLLSHLLLELSWLMEFFYPELRTIYIKPVVSSSFHPKWYIENGINYLWWVKYNCDDIVWCISFLTMAVIAYQFNFRLFCIVFMFFLYHSADYLLLWWDYNTSHWIYVVGLIMILVSVVLIILPVKNKQAIIKKMN